jgi:hypothetical protein
MNCTVFAASTSDWSSAMAVQLCIRGHQLELVEAGQEPAGVPMTSVVKLARQPERRVL